VASVSKIFTTLAILKLIENGVVKLDLPIVKYLPGFDQYNRDSSIDKTIITVKHLLTHTSGFPPEPIPRLDSQEMRDLSVEQLKRSVTENICENEPGTTYVYSGKC
jgi:CubicO group peptidase (beta-lactamase class C family)